MPEIQLTLYVVAQEVQMCSIRQSQTGISKEPNYFFNVFAFGFNTVPILRLRMFTRSNSLSLSPGKAIWREI